MNFYNSINIYNLFYVYIMYGCRYMGFVPEINLFVLWLSMLIVGPWLMPSPCFQSVLWGESGDVFCVARLLHLLSGARIHRGAVRLYLRSSHDERQLSRVSKQAIIWWRHALSLMKLIPLWSIFCKLSFDITRDVPHRAHVPSGPQWHSNITWVESRRASSDTPDIGDAKIALHAQLASPI